ncbi:MAG: ABC-F family ATP-binding cassette domain-containing protein [Gammaproteobacteria bacterium]|nr:ABC-F family ATP-binding cassette domain-containing protein [Gammaproteobacteria bacterium]
MHKPILLQDLSLSFSHKTCFENFNARILPGSRIAIIGRNGSGKSSLLNILQGTIEPTNGKLIIPEDLHIAALPQMIEGSLSGGECFNQALNDALNEYPDVLLLDEPTNHLDGKNRKALLQLLHDFKGTLIVVSHDVELLRKNIDIFWHIDQEQIHIFQGNYNDYMHEREQQRLSLEHKKSQLNKQKKAIHQHLMQEQQRAAKSREKGEKSIDKRKWPTVGSKAKMARATTTSINNKAAMRNKGQNLTTQLSELYLPKIITPRFSLNANISRNQNLITVNDGSIAYSHQAPILSNINLCISSHDRVAVRGNNGSGKSTLIKALLFDATVIRSGEWLTPKISDIGYLDQHYSTLINSDSALNTIQRIVPKWSILEVRRHLTDFLFFNNEEVNTHVSFLSGGEKARLSLAQIAAITPQLLILDEVTNNLDLESRAHVIQVLKDYPGALLVISHDEDFLIEIGTNDYYDIENRILKYTTV